MENKEPNQASNSNGSRRKALKSILAGSGGIVTAAAMQDKWVRPVIESVLLPAHAQTSSLVPPLLIGMEPTFNGLATNTDGQSCGSPIDYFTPDLVITNTLGCTANLFTHTLVSADDLLEIDGVIWPNAQCGSAVTEIPADTLLLGNIAPGSSVTIRVLDAVSVVLPIGTGGFGTLRLECI